MEEATPLSPSPLDDVRKEGLRLVEAAAARDLPLRLLGGVAVWARCPSAELPGLHREPNDVDVIADSRRRHEITALLEELGYVPDKLFNALHGAQRLNFWDPLHERGLDVLVDQFSMCHSLDLSDRLALEPVTIPLADLLLTKLQVIELNGKDVRDVVAILADHDVGVGGDGQLDIARVTSVLGEDWGFEHTIRLNLARVADALGELDLPDAVRDTVRGRIDRLVAALDVAPKSLKWKLRRAVGERVRWYELPEEGRR